MIDQDESGRGEGKGACPVAVRLAAVVLKWR